MKRIVKRLGVVVTMFVFLAYLITLCTYKVYAQDTTLNPGGKMYELDAKSKYAYQGVASSSIATTGSQFGTLGLTGDITSIPDVGGFSAYEVSEGKVKFTYKTDGTVIGAAETYWHVIDDNNKEINGEKLDDKIMKGALILQSSNNGVNWITDDVKTNIAGSGTTYTPDFFETREIQQINGCYYRVIVAYELEIRHPDTKGAFGTTKKNYEKKKCVEVYEFYIKDITEAKVEAGTHPNTNKVVGDGTKVVNTGKDNGYSGINALTVKDPHYGWKIGDFTLRGYTNTADYQGEEYFLKNYGDAVTLDFKLEHDINKLHGNDKLLIAEDANGSDQGFQVDKQNFKHGALIIQFTNFEGKKTNPIVYTDYLAAYARTGADTRVQLFEEGDYEVALDYEIKDTTGIDSLHDYRLFFTFKIRNGNNMVYAFDSSTKKQLADGEITTNGFTIDTANSHYLTVTVNKYSLIDIEGRKTEDLSWSRTAADGNTYTDTGKYTVTVSNKYQPNGDVTKTFYVGDDPFLKAMSSTGKTVDEINDKLAENYTITANGTLASPTPTPSPIPTETPTPTPEPVIETTDVEEDVEPVVENMVTPSPTMTPTPTEIQVNDDIEDDIEDEAFVEDSPKAKVKDKTKEKKKAKTEDDDEDEDPMNIAPIIVIVAVTASACGVFLFQKKKRSPIDMDKTGGKPNEEN